MSQIIDTEKKERKMDRRTVYTRKVIMDSYIQLLKEKPKEKIRITEICKLADINRCTFYLHFEDITAVSAAIEEELFEKFKKHVKTQNSKSKDRLSLSDNFIDTMLHDETYRTLMSLSSSSWGLSESMQEFYLNEMKSSLPQGHHLSEREQELLYTFIVGGVTAVEQNWISNNANVKEENEFLDKLVQRIMSIPE